MALEFNAVVVVVVVRAVVELKAFRLEIPLVAKASLARGEDEVDSTFKRASSFPREISEQEKTGVKGTLVAGSEFVVVAVVAVELETASTRERNNEIPLRRAFEVNSFRYDFLGI